MNYEKKSNSKIENFFMMAQVPFNQEETITLNTPDFSNFDDLSNQNILQSIFEDFCILKTLLDQDSRVLELGCGNGYFMEYLYQHGLGKYYGCEPIPVQANEAERRLSKITTSDNLIQNTCIEDALYEAEKFTHIYSYHVLEHLENPFVLVEQSIKWLAPGGKLIIICPNVEGAIPKKDIFDWRFAKIRSHRWLPGLSNVKQMLVRYGFDVLSSFTYGGYTFPRTWYQEVLNKYFKLVGRGDVLCILSQKSTS